MILKVDPDNPELDAIEEAVDVLLDGGVIALPTDTVYGLAVDATNPRAVEALRALKGRDADKPIAVLIDSMTLFRNLTVRPSEHALQMAEAYWPGALTLVVNKRKEALRAVSGDTSLGLRMPDHLTALSVISMLARPVAASSANLSGEPVLRSAREIADIFGNQLDLILDAGEIGGDGASTVLDMTGDKCRILREGPIGRAKLRETLGDSLEEGKPRRPLATPAALFASRRWCFSTLGCAELDLPGVLKLADRFGVREIELRALSDNMDVPTELEKEFGTPEKLRAALDAARVRVAVIDTSFGLIGADDAKRAQLLRFPPWADALGTPWLRVFDGGKFEDVLSEDYIREASETVAWWRKTRAENNWKTDIIIETHDALCSAENCARFEAALDEPVGLLWDAHHPWFKAKEPLATTWRRIRQHVRHVHFKDSLREPILQFPYTYQLLGKGAFPLSELIALLDRDGFVGAISLEWERKWHPYLPPLDEALDSLARFMAGPEAEYQSPLDSQ
jgi:tRNA threonylcarbamoyl adenosine modification protein (Sua5/YciO/YrdC/YwlC family)